MPPYFNIANPKSIDEEKKILYLDVPAQNIPTTVFWDACLVNLKGSKLLDEIHGIKSHPSTCVSHASAVTIKRLCTSQITCQSNTKYLYENLRAP